MHYCRLGYWGNQAKIAEMEGILGAHKEHMCTALLTHFPVYTWTHSYVIQVYVPWDLSQAPHTSQYVYMYEYIDKYLWIDCTHIFICSMAGTVLFPKTYPSWTCNLSCCVAETGAATSIQPKLPACGTLFFQQTVPKEEQYCYIFLPLSKDPTLCWTWG